MESRIIVNPHICHGKPVVRGTRIMVADVLDLLESGKSFNEIINNYFPDLTPEDIASCVYFASAMVQNEEIVLAAS
ncbi:MAG: DUF433 domain-containing protein [Bacteroidetes bacterium]|nr:MAG: DUF433 domain-containing protein [Bacteroidota bacterium]